MTRLLFRNQILSFALAASFVLASGCSSTGTLDTNTPEGAFKLGQKYEKDERYEEALAQYSIVKNKHPYSKLATESELQIAEIYYTREEYVEAQNAYQVFKEMHPSYARIDYVTYKLGLSFYQQLPSTIDRDLSVADRAILYFDEVQASYPNSEFRKDAIDFKNKALKMLAEKEYYVAHFYYIRDFYDSALGRYEGMLLKYPDLGFDARALLGAAMSAYYTKDLGKAKKFYDRLQSGFKGSKEAEKARDEIGDRI